MNVNFNKEEHATAFIIVPKKIDGIQVFMCAQATIEKFSCHSVKVLQTFHCVFVGASGQVTSDGATGLPALTAYAWLYGFHGNRQPPA